MRRPSLLLLAAALPLLWAARPAPNSPASATIAARAASSSTAPAGIERRGLIEAPRARGRGDVSDGGVVLCATWRTRGSALGRDPGRRAADTRARTLLKVQP